MVALFRTALLLAAVPALIAQAPAPVLEADALSGLRARNIGPASMSGRIAALDGVLEKGRVTIFVGAASGGVWKSSNGGTTFKPVFDKYNQSIGAIRIDPKDTNTIWVGTGEPWVRNSVSVGDGIYKTTDGGDNWTRMGLPDSERIAGIEIDPTDSKTVYAAAMGRLWAAGGERGLYKTTDGGTTWKRTLFVDENTGCSGLAMDPKNPKVLFAAMWDYRRTGWSFRSGGSGSGLYRSEDGGETWAKLTGDAKSGLPGGVLGRIVVAVAPSDPRIVYAAVEAQEGALYRSEDGGRTWAWRFKGPKVLARPFYFGAMTVDPKNPDRLYKMGYNMALSEDGGRTFTQLGRGTHGDHHAIWINPEFTDTIYLGDDGGFFVTEDRGNAWRYHRNLPLGQFYHVSADEGRPYRLVGGLQDNSTWLGYGSVNLSNRHWKNIFGGDGFWAFIDPTDPDYAYAESQGGELGRINLRTMTTRDIKPRESAGEPKFRFNWDTPIHLSPNQKGTLYLGGQYLFRSKDKGDSWERLSPDLTTNDPEKQKQEESGGLIVDNSSAENHCTILTLSESPKNGKVIWAGTDDGNLQLTRDAGKTWTNLSSKIPGLPANTSVAWIEASSHAEGTAFAAFDGHTRGDMASRVYRTDDYGQTWISLATSDLQGFAHVVKQDPVRANLLYLGTEAGLFLSVDGGAHWAAFKGGDFPPVPVRDLVVQPREQDLIIATHGRGIWIIDDLTPLRALTPEILGSQVALLPTRPFQAQEMNSDGWVDGDLEFTGEDRPYGAVIAYWQRKRHLFGDLRIEILDEKGKLLQSISGSKAKGLNRVTWDRMIKSPRVALGATPNFGSFMGPQVLEGTYTVRLIKGKDVLTAPLVLQADPASPFTRADRQARFDTAMRLYGMIEGLAYTVDRVRELRDEARNRAAACPDPGLKTRLEALATEAEAVRGKFVPVKDVEGLTGEDRLREKLSEIYGAVTGYRGRPSRTLLDRTEAVERDIASATGTFETVLQRELAALNEGLAKAGLPPLKPLERSAWEARSQVK
jgi:photosystem II stability/assembly factor-like uncharacterized protein